MNEVRQSLSDVIDVYCRSVTESQVTDTVNFLPTVAAAIVTNVMQTLQQASQLLTLSLSCLLYTSPSPRD